MIDVSELVGVASQRTGEAPSEKPLIAGFLSGVRMMIALRVLTALSGVYNRLQRQPRFCDPHWPRWDHPMQCEGVRSISASSIAGGAVTPVGDREHDCHLQLQAGTMDVL